MSIRIPGRQESRLLGRVIRIVHRQREGIPEDARRFFERDPVAGAVAPILARVPLELQLSISPRLRVRAETPESGPVRIVEVPIVIQGDTGLAAWVAVLAADGERRADPGGARRGRRFAIELCVHATADRLRQRDAEAAGMAPQSPMLFLREPYLRTHHGVSVAPERPAITPDGEAVGVPMENRSVQRVATSWASKTASRLTSTARRERA